MKTTLRPPGRFFSLKGGQVGQFLSRRVLRVTKPFQGDRDHYYIGFEHAYQAERFIRRIARVGQVLSLERSRLMPQPYEIHLVADGQIIRILSAWERQNQPLLPSKDISHDPAFHLESQPQC